MRRRGSKEGLIKVGEGSGVQGGLLYYGKLYNTAHSGHASTFIGGKALYAKQHSSQETAKCNTFDWVYVYHPSFSLLCRFVHQKLHTKQMPTRD